MNQFVFIFLRMHSNRKITKLKTDPKTRIINTPAKSFSLSGTVLLAAIFLDSESEQRLSGGADRFSAYCINPACCNIMRLLQTNKIENQPAGANPL